MLTALVFCLLGQAPSVESEPTVAVFTAPLATIVPFAVAAEFRQTPIIFAPLGVLFTAAKIDWSLDAAFVRMSTSTGFTAGADAVGSQGFDGMWLALGPTFHTGPGALQGVFITPKATIGVFFVGAKRTFLSALVGADVGYQFTLGRFYFAFVAGASAGLAWGDNDLWAGPVTDLGSRLSEPGFGAAVGLNLQLLRIGYTF